jgi:dTDP-4-dehydrorhamnose reductase
MRILILGGSGFIGRHLYQRLGSDLSVATYNLNPASGMIPFDSLTMDLNRLLDRMDGISHAVILLGDVEPNSCYRNVKRSYALNVESIKRIVDVLKGRDIRCIFTSSHYVFDGKKGEYVEADPLNPILLYGHQKVEIEKYIQKNCFKFTIFRVDKVYGCTPKDKTLFTNWVDALMGGQTSMKCATDQRFSPVWVQDVVTSICTAIEKDLYGLYHLSGPNPHSRWELLEMLMAALDQHMKVEVKVIPCSINDFDLPEKRPADVSLKPDKLVEKTGIVLHNADGMCRRIVKKYFN